jgi:hypothetical protein
MKSVIFVVPAVALGLVLLACPGDREAPGHGGPSGFDRATGGAWGALGPGRGTGGSAGDAGDAGDAETGDAGETADDAASASHVW